jgi:hypothetical protein
MAGPTSTICNSETQEARTPLGSARAYDLFDAGSDTLYLPYPSRRATATVDMTLRVLKPDGTTVDWPFWAKTPEDIVFIAIKSTGSNFNSSTLKVYY